MYSLPAQTTYQSMARLLQINIYLPAEHKDVQELYRHVHLSSVYLQAAWQHLGLSAHQHSATEHTHMTTYQPSVLVYHKARSEHKPSIPSQFFFTAYNIKLTLDHELSILTDACMLYITFISQKVYVPQNVFAVCWTGLECSNISNWRWLSSVILHHVVW